jgi:hypothetical protein
MRLGLNDDDFQSLQLQLMNNTEAGAVIPGSGGYRKLRVKLPGKGKRGGARVIYIVYQEKELIELDNVYAKTE